MCDSTLHLLTTTVGRLADVCQRSHYCLIFFWYYRDSLQIVFVSGAVAKAAVLSDTAILQQCNHSAVQKSDSPWDQEEGKPGSQL